MTVKVAINGFGRIGRVLRAIVEPGRKDIQVVAVNDLGPVETNAHLLRFDPACRSSEVKVEGDSIVVDGQKIRVTAIKNPAELPHKELDVDIALECTGLFTAKDKAKAHLEAGREARPRLGPRRGQRPHRGLRRQSRQADEGPRRRFERLLHDELPAPVAKVLHEAVGIEKGFATTIHSYTNDQPSSTRCTRTYRARAAALSMIPT